MNTLGIMQHDTQLTQGIPLLRGPGRSSLTRKGLRVRVHRARRAAGWWLIAIGLLAAGTPDAWAFGLLESAPEWKRGKPVTFVLNMAGAPETFTEAQILDFLGRAFTPWADVETAWIAPRIDEVIDDPSKTTPTRDGQNVIFWKFTDTPTDTFFAGKAYTFASECDIWLFPRSPFTLIDVQGTLLHELGHCLGLAHSAATGVMTKFTGLPILGQDDAVGLSVIHPAAAPLIRTTATIKGRVLRKGRPVLGAMLRILDRRNGRIIVAGFSGLVDGQRRADASGRFELPGIPPGRYRLLVEPMDGFIANDPGGYGAPVDTPPAFFQKLSVDLPALDAGDIHDVGKLTVKER